MMTAWCAGLAAGVAAYLLPGTAAGAPRSLRARRMRPAAVGLVGAIGIGSAAVALLHGTQIVVVLVAAAVGAAVAQDIGRRHRVAAADRRAELVLMMCEGLAADLQAGQPPVAALDAAAADWPELVPVASAAHLGADVPAAFRALSARPGAAPLRIVAAAWQVAHRSGAGLARALALAADDLRADRATARTVATELAAAEATARLLAAMPIGVLLLGSGLGGDPVGFLLATPAGLGCLCTGLGLAYLGLLWLGRIGDRVTGRAVR